MYVLYSVTAILLAQYNESKQNGDFESSDFDDQFASEKLFFEFNVKAYADFLEGSDDFETLETELAHTFGA